MAKQQAGARACSAISYQLRNLAGYELLAEAIIVGIS